MNLTDLFKKEKPCIFSEITGTTVILGPVMSESESGSVRITDNAVEGGDNVSDHVSKDPESVDITVYLVDPDNLLAKAAGAVKSSIGFSVDKMTVTEKLTLLRMWRDEGEIVTYSGPVFSGLLREGYEIIAESMVITKVDTSRSAETASGISVNISLRKIVIAQAVMKNSKLPTAAKKTTKKGNSTTKTDKVSAKPNSMLKRIFQ